MSIQTVQLKPNVTHGIIRRAVQIAVVFVILGGILFLAAGTSGTVWPASSFVRSASYAGARTILVNLDPRDDAYDEHHVGRAEELLPRLLDVPGV